MGKLSWGVSVGVVMAAVVLASSVSAGIILPESSHYDGTIINGGVLIQFAVYDSDNGNEFALANFEAPGTGRFTYVYQLFVGDLDDDYIERFDVIGIGNGAVTGEGQIGSVDDEADGIDSSDAYFDGTFTIGSWEFGDGTLIMDEHSVFLIIRSDSDWVKGDYNIQRSADFPVPGGDPGGEVPEPMTLAFLAVGGLGLLRCRKARS